MNRSQWVSLLTFVLGVGTFRMYAHQIEKEARGGALHEVLIITKDMAPGSVLVEKDLGVLAVPADYLDGRHILAEDRPHLLGAALGERLLAGDQLVWSDLAEDISGERLAKVIAPGMRAYSLPADVNPLGQLLHSGDQVDVLVEAESEATLLLERILVLAVGGRTDPGEHSQDSAPRRSSVTISVTQQQAFELLAAESNGRLRLVLRNAEDGGRTTRAGTPQPEEARAHRNVAVEAEREIEHVR